ELPRAVTEVMADQLAGFVDNRLIRAVAYIHRLTLGDIFEGMIDMPRRGRRFGIIFRQRERAIPAAFRLELRPVVDLDRCQRAGGGVEPEETVAVDRVAAVLLVDPAVVKEDAFAVGIVNNLVPPLRSETPLIVGAGKL